MPESPRSTFTSTIRLRLRVPARLRNLELVLLLFAIAIDVAAIALVQLGALGQLDLGVLALSGLLGLLLIGMHIALRVVA
ncbi:MAG TPA: cell division protein FtsW, partial [Rhodoglobus sp.]|nr:cell division protein FtsW [Rhodoglobus sp.]